MPAKGTGKTDRDLSGRLKSLPLLLLRWYRRHHRDLPWRRTRDPYPIWVSEVMLQQTQVSTVIPYYERFMRSFPTVRHLAKAPEQRVLKVWEGLGYYSRARNLRQGAQVICRKHGGEIPSERTDLLRIPGIGEYTASAILSIAFNQHLPVYDGNVRRVLARLTAQAATPQNLRKQSRIREVLETWIARTASPGSLNQALMELGQTVCTPKSPHCDRCPISRCCLARIQGKQALFPAPKKRPPVPHYNVAVGIIHIHGRVVIQKRPSSGLLGGLWEFPGGKIEAGETPETAVRRELWEELNLRVDPLSKLPKVEHAYSHFSVTLHPFLCRPRGRSRRPLPQRARWVPLTDLRRFPFPSANRKIFAELDRVLS
ncbi:MAG: A/G-specific adenine glycosylase [Nitrospirae bacterium]|nr:A/G-specific adenine glycosylase [Nitrospirota bacterium]